MPELSVTVNRVAYPPATDTESKWFILITDQGACKGKMAWRPQDGEALILDGEFTTYKGEREFSFEGARIDVPTNPRDMLHYVCVRTNGLGPAAEVVIWSQKGADWATLKDGEVGRITGKVYANFQLQLEALRSKSVEAQVVAALMGKGATVNMASKAWELWKEETLGVVNADCFRLAELEGYSFRDVDTKIRQSYSITDDDKRRIRAGVIYALRRLTDGGDTVVQWDDLYQQTIGLLGGYADLISECTTELFDEGTLKGFAKSEGVSLKSDWEAEHEIMEYVNAL
jgi:hypothetical protein